MTTKQLADLCDDMRQMVDLMDDAMLMKVKKPFDHMMQTIGDAINSLSVSGDMDKHTYYVNNGYAKVQLQKLLPDGCDIRISPDIELGTIIMVKQY